MHDGKLEFFGKGHHYANHFFCDLRLLFLASFDLFVIEILSTIKRNLKCMAKKSIRGHKSAWSFCGLESDIDLRTTLPATNFSWGPLGPLGLLGPLGRVKFKISHTLHQFQGLKGSDK